MRHLWSFLRPVLALASEQVLGQAKRQSRARAGSKSGRAERMVIYVTISVPAIHFVVSLSEKRRVAHRETTNV